MTRYENWTTFKLFKTTDGLTLHYSQNDGDYSVCVITHGVPFITLQSGTADYTDFEDNHKTAARKIN